jgi:membrane fusion protein (multidrug efflux system)
VTQPDRQPAPEKRKPFLRLATDEPRRRSYRAIAIAAIAVAGVAATGVHFLRAGRESTDNAQVEADVVALAPRIGGVVTRVMFVENQPVKAGDPLVELDSRAARAKLLEAEAELKSAEAQRAGAAAEVSVVGANTRGARSVARAVLAGTQASGRSKGEEIAEVEAQLSAASVEEQAARVELGRMQQLYDQRLIEPARYDAAKAAAQRAAAKLDETRAHLRAVKSSPELARALTDEAAARLEQTGAGGAQVAQARARLESAEARVAVASAAVELARLEVAYSTITAPADGVAAKKSVAVGQLLTAGQTIAHIVPIGEVWVNANFKETQLGHMRAGQPAEVRVDSYPGVIFRGEVESLSGATGARFTLLPPDNATGNFVKVVQRVPVRIRLTPSAKDGRSAPVLRPGMSATVTVRTDRD